MPEITFNCEDLINAHKEKWKEVTSGMDEYIATIKKRKVWDNLGKVEKQDVENVILSFLNAWQCRISYKHSTELQTALIASSKYLYLLKDEKIETVNFYKKIKVGKKEMSVRDVIENSYNPLDKVKHIGPTAISKIMHLSIPNLFIMTDIDIRWEYGYSDNSEGYINFLIQMQKLLNKALEEYCKANKVDKKTAINHS